MIEALSSFDNIEKYLDPNAIVEYLKRTGWKKYKFSTKEVVVYQYYTENTFFQVNLPMKKDFSDYKEALIRAVKEISRKEAKGVDEVLFCLSNPVTDILELSFQSEKENPLISMPVVVDILEYVRNLVIFIAKKLLVSAKFKDVKSDNIVDEIIENCYFRQNKLKKNIISILFPFIGVQDGIYKRLNIRASREECQKSLTRRVTIQLMTELAYLRNYLDQDIHGDDNKNTLIYKSFSKMYSIEREINVDFQAKMKWAPTVTSIDRTTLSQISFSGEDTTKIKNIIKRYEKTKTWQETHQKAVFGKTKAQHVVIPIYGRKSTQVNASVANRRLQKMRGNLIEVNRRKKPNVMYVDIDAAAVSDLFKNNKKILLKKDGSRWYAEKAPK